MQCSNQPCDQFDQLKGLAESARQAAFQSMIAASAYGALMLFIKNSFAAVTHQPLVELFFDYMDSLGLSSSLQIRSRGVIETWCGPHQPTDAIEAELFEALKFKGRVFDFNHRTIFNATNVSILIKNMPEDVEDYGRKKDILAVLLECCEARISSLEKQDVLREILNLLIESVTDLNKTLKKNNDKTVCFMEQLMEEVRISFDNLALTEEQEEDFTMMVDKTMGKLVEMHMDGWDAADKFKKIINAANEQLATPPNLLQKNQV